MLNKSQRNSIDYVINSLFRKVFDTRSQEVTDVCLGMFNCLPAQQVIAIRVRKRKSLKNSAPPAMHCVVYVQIMQ